MANTFENAILEQEKLLFKSIVALPQVSNPNEGPTKTWAPTIIQKLWKKIVWLLEKDLHSALEMKQKFL